MKKNIFTKSLCGAMAGLLMAGSMVMPVFADEVKTGTNPTKMTIDVTASVDSTYVISVPADIFGNGGDSIHLTRDHDDMVSYAGDTMNAFYGGSFVEATGTIGTGKTLTVGLKCSDLVNQVDSSKKADVGITALDAATLEKIEKIWGGTATAADKVAFADGAFEDAETTGIQFTYSAGTYTPTDGKKHYMLHTVPSVDGTYKGQLTITFGL